jgi:hypothetical protein
MRKVFLTTLRATATVFVADDSFVSIDIGYGCRANPSHSISPVACIQNGDARGACRSDRMSNAASALIWLALTTATSHIPALPGIRRTQGFRWLA